MKKFCFTLLVAICFNGVAAKAQQASDLHTQAMEDTRTLAQKITLDDARIPKVKRLTYERLLQETEVKKMYSIDPDMLQSKMAVIEKEYAEKLKGLLSDTQYQRYMVATMRVSAAAPAAAVAAQPASVPAPAAKYPALPKSKSTPVAPGKKVTSGIPAGTTAATRP